MSAKTIKHPTLVRISRKDYQHLFGSFSHGVLRINPVDGTIIKANLFLTDLLAYENDELKGKPLSALGGLPDAQANEKQVRYLLDQHYLRFDDLPLRAEDGSHARCSFRTAGTSDDGAVIIVCNFRGFATASADVDDNDGDDSADAPGKPGAARIERDRYRQAFVANAECEVERARRYAYPLSLLSLEIDRRPMPQENGDHRISDLVLKDFAKTCARTLRGSDRVGRTGLGAFVSLLPETDSVAAVTAAERLCAMVADLELSSKVGNRCSVTLSIGIATDDRSYASLRNRADAQRERARRDGGDRVYGCGHYAQAMAATAAPAGS